MLTKPQYGWTHIQFPNITLRASYLTDVPNDCLDSFIYALQNNSPVVICFDAEGYDYHLVLSYYRSYIIVDKEDNSVDTYIIEKGIIELAMELMNDIEDNFEDWLNWECDDDDIGEYTETNREVFKVKLSMLKFELNKRICELMRNNQCYIGNEDEFYLGEDNYWRFNGEWCCDYYNPEADCCRPREK